VGPHPHAPAVAYAPDPEVIAFCSLVGSTNHDHQPPTTN